MKFGMEIGVYNLVFTVLNLI